MKILITGSRGFVGTETVKLLEKEVEVTRIGSGSTSKLEMSSFPECKHEIIGFDLMDGYDIRDRDLLENVIESENPDRILHLAAVARFADADADPKLAFETNVDGTRNVAELAEAYHVPVVYASTGSVYMPILNMEDSIKEDWRGVGNSVYGCTKYMGETLIRGVNPHIILRYAHLYGKEKRTHGLIGGFMDRISRGLAPTLYGGKQSNDFTYILDVAAANVAALTAPWDKWNQAYNIGTGEELTAEEAGKIICEHAGYKGEIDVKKGRTVDPDRFFFDCSKAERMLGFKAEYGFADGLKHMFKED